MSELISDWLASLAPNLDGDVRLAAARVITFALVVAFAFIAYVVVKYLFDHLLSIIPEFGLKVFQYPAGADLKGLAQKTNQKEPVASWL